MKPKRCTQNARHPYKHSQPVICRFTTRVLSCRSARLCTGITRIFILAVVLYMLFPGIQTFAVDNVPYHTYNYDYWGDVYYTPAAYVPSGNYSGDELGVGSFSNPQDIFAAQDGRIYVADTGNNRIVVIDRKLNSGTVIDGFVNQGTADTFTTPSGVFVTEDNELYIADTDNLRIVALNSDGSLLRILENPKSEVLGEDFVFAPLKVSVDYADRVYTVVKNMFQGIMAFDEKANFTGFTGTIKVNISVYEKVWRYLSTKAQRERQIQFIPTEFTNVDMAPDGFVYATNFDPKGEQSVRRLNPKGQDIIKKREGQFLSGDEYWRIGREYAGPSRIVDVVYRGSGIYSILDTTRGRIFTYDHEGNLLYIFGGKGSQDGTFRNPTAIEVLDDRFLALDGHRGEIMVFTQTEYGSLINRATALRYDGDEASAVQLWEQVLKLDSNFELAYSGIGKSLLAAGDNRKAMDYLKLGMDREYYSIAFKRYRDDLLKENLGVVLTLLVVAIAVLQVRKFVLKSRKKGAVTVE